MYMYEATLYGMKESKKSTWYVHCGVCSGFSVISGGVHDVKLHDETKKHSELTGW